MSAIVLRGDAAHLPLPDASVDLLLCSPPYWGLRSYTDNGEHYRGQIGSEATPQEWLEAMWRCTAEWMRVLKPSGSMFIDLGDKYAAGHGGRSTEGDGDNIRVRRTRPAAEHWTGSGSHPSKSTAVIVPGFRPKTLMLLPERYRIGCVDRLGLIVREVIEWHKPNPIPESARDRCRRTHEDIVHLVKQPRYFAAVDEIREPHSENTNPGSLRTVGSQSGNGVRHRTFAGDTTASNPLGKVPGSVWTIPSVPLVVPDRVAHARCCGGRKRPGCTDELDHHAAFPPALVAPVILGWSPSGICLKCGESRLPVVDRAKDVRHGDGRHRPGAQQLREGADVTGYAQVAKWDTRATITGYACACPDASAPTRPAVVLDPFGGTGTTSLVADVLGRTGITIDRSADYCRLAHWRTSDPAERARALGVPKPPPVPEGQASLFDEAS